jgi:RNA polymerase sigma-70 factor (ECF subfamily)
MTEGPGPDTALVAQARDGDEAAFRALYRRHTPRAFAVVVRMLAWRRADAEDVLQEAWLRAATSLAGFRGDSAFATWFTGIAIRCAYECLRRRPMAGGADAIGQVATHDGRRELALDLERAVAVLPDGYRTVLVLHDVHGYTHGEIARLLDVDEGTSKSQLSRARRAVRARLGQETSETGT